MKKAPSVTRLPDHQIAVHTVNHLLAFVLLMLIAGSPGWAQRPDGSIRAVAVTLDDLPYTGGLQRVDQARYVTDSLVTILARYDVPASGFVTGANVMVPGEVDARLAMLRRWRDAGARLENHSHAHNSYHGIAPGAYLDDIVRGNLIPELLRREVADSVRWFRAPFNHTGATRTERAMLEQFLVERKLHLAPFTVEHADYVMNRLYLDALQRGDHEQAERLGEVYLAQLDSAFAFAEWLSVETFGREIPQVFLIHSNRINADYLGAMLQRLAERGYQFLSLDDAVADGAYATPDPYVGAYGISWLHRWRQARGLDDKRRDEPDYPRWIYEAYRHLEEGEGQ